MTRKFLSSAALIICAGLFVGGTVAFVGCLPALNSSGDQIQNILPTAPPTDQVHAAVEIELQNAPDAQTAFAGARLSTVGGGGAITGNLSGLTILDDDPAATAPVVGWLPEAADAGKNASMQSLSNRNGTVVAAGETIINMPADGQVVFDTTDDVTEQGDDIMGLSIEHPSGVQGLRGNDAIVINFDDLAQLAGVDANQPFGIDLLLPEEGTTLAGAVIEVRNTPATDGTLDIDINDSGLSGLVAVIADPEAITNGLRFEIVAADITAAAATVNEIDQIAITLTGP